MNKIFYKVDEIETERIDYTVIDDSEYYCDKEPLSSIFDKYEVPEEFRLLFFYKALFSNDIKEFLTDTTLEFANKSLKGFSYKRKGDKDKEQSHFYYMSITNTCNKDYIKEFFTKLEENNCLNRYLQALNEYLLLRLNSYSINKISDSKESLETKKRFINDEIKIAR